MQMIGLAVHGLKSPETLIPAVQVLGRRHVAYGVEEKNYETVGKALILTLEQGLGADFTPQVKEAWLATYQLLSEILKQAAYTKPQAASQGQAAEGVAAPPTGLGDVQPHLALP
jgi:hemoglobin-like flavoprotein